MTDNIKLPSIPKAIESAISEFAVACAYHGSEQRANAANALRSAIEAYAAEAVRTNVAPVADRCPLCRYQHGHQIGCENNPLDIALRAAANTEPQGDCEWTHCPHRVGDRCCKEPQGVPEPATHPQQSGAAQPEQERKPLSESEIDKFIFRMFPQGSYLFRNEARAAREAIRWAERHQGITKESP